MICKIFDVLPLLFQFAGNVSLQNRRSTFTDDFTEGNIDRLNCWRRDKETKILRVRSMLIIQLILR